MKQNYKHVCYVIIGPTTYMRHTYVIHGISDWKIVSWDGRSPNMIMICMARSFLIMTLIIILATACVKSPGSVETLKWTCLASSPDRNSYSMSALEHFGKICPSCFSIFLIYHIHCRCHVMKSVWQHVLCSSVCNTKFVNTTHRLLFWLFQKFVGYTFMVLTFFLVWNCNFFLFCSTTLVYLLHDHNATSELNWTFHVPRDFEFTVVILSFRTDRSGQTV